MDKNIKLLMFAKIRMISLLLVLVMNATPLRGDSKTQDFFTVSFTARKNADQIQLQAQVTPKAPLILNNEGPWQLDISSKDLTFSPDMAKNKLFDHKLNQFLVSSSNLSPIKKAAGTMQVRVIGFVCTADKSICYRKILETTVPWPGNVIKVMTDERLSPN